LSLEPVHTDTPEREFERQWILTLLDNVVRRLEDEFASTGKARQFELLKETLTGGRAVINYTAVAAELSISEEAARQAAHRLRRRYRELLREEVAATVESDAEVEDEIGRLLSSLGT
jgi:RNA polymerase sigma-70 factor (ECF subfamily)